MTIATMLLVFAASVVASPAEKEIADFKLQDFRGAWHSLSDEVKDKKAVVIAFLGVDCPLSDVYASKLADLAREFGPRGIAILGVDANQQDAPTSMARFATAHDLTFPLLKDVGNAVADRLGAERTPEVVVIDPAKLVRYRGRVDDQYAIGVHRSAATSKDLALALEDILAGRDVAKPKTEAVGCKIGRAKAQGKGNVTYSGQVSKILKERCVACHRDGDIAPFALNSYTQASGWAEMIAEVVSGGRMPPWHANPEYGHFANDATLSDTEKKTLVAWAEDGAPEGEASSTPEPVAIDEGWRIGKPDLIVSMPKEARIPATGTLPYRNIIIDPKFDHDVWVRATQVRPGNPSVVHHLVIFVMPPGDETTSLFGAELLAAYAPGMPPRIMPEGVARRVLAGSKLLLQLHYTPRGTPQTDLSRVGLVFTDPAKVKKRLASEMVINPSLRIPAGEADYKLSASYKFNQDYVLYALMPHMHLRGKSFQFEATYPDGRKEILLDVPRYEFDWQNVYTLIEPKKMPEGTVMRCFAQYDNSAANPNNPDPKANVRFGEQTKDEMLVGYFDAALDFQDLSLGLPTWTPRPDGRFDVTFRHQPPAGTKTVSLASNFNDWKPDAQPMTGPDATGAFQVTIPLEAGRVEYKFVLDGKIYKHDPGNSRQSGFYHNSVIEVGPAK